MPVGIFYRIGFQPPRLNAGFSIRLLMGRKWRVDWSAYSLGKSRRGFSAHDVVLDNGLRLPHREFVLHHGIIDPEADFACSNVRQGFPAVFIFTFCTTVVSKNCQTFSLITSL